MKIKGWVVVWACLLLGIGGYAGYRGFQAAERKGCLQDLEDVVTVRIQPASPDRLRFIALGDTGTGTPGQARVAQAVRQVCAKEGCDFILLLGDNFYPSGVKSLQDEKFVSRYQALYDPIGKPVLAVLGNHDVRSNPIYQVMYTLISDTWRMPNYSYRFIAGPVRFYAVNSNCSLIQWRSLAQTLEQAPDFPGWTFVYGHHSLYSTGPHGDADPVTRFYWGRFLEPRIDFYLSGHNHVLEHLDLPGQRTDFVVSGAGGYVDDEANPPDQGKEGGSQAKRHTSAAKSLFESGAGGFARFEVTSDEVEMRFYDGNGRRLYEYTRRRTSGSEMARR